MLCGRGAPAGPATGCADTRVRSTRMRRARDNSRSAQMRHGIQCSNGDHGRHLGCALHRIPTCHSNSYVVSLARNKLHVHSILKRFGISVPESWSYEAGRGWLLGRRPPRGCYADRQGAP